MLQEDSSSVSPEIEARARNIYSALSNSDSLRIFNLASEGIDASTSVLEKYQFTKKRYYGRLKELVDLGLIVKEEGEYRHTMLGSLVFESQVRDLEQILLKKSNVAIVAEARRKDASPFAIKSISRQLIEDIETSTGVTNLEPMKFFDNWNELSLDVAMEIEMMKKELYVATRYVDFRTADVALRAAKKECKVSIIHSPRDGMSTKSQLVGNLMTHPKALSVFKELISHPNVSLREATIPYSFLVIDSKIVGLEIVNPEDPFSFFFGVKFENERLAAKLALHFDALMSKGGIDSIAAVIESNHDNLEKQSRQDNRLLTN